MAANRQEIEALARACAAAYIEAAQAARQGREVLGESRVWFTAEGKAAVDAAIRKSTQRARSCFGELMLAVADLRDAGLADLATAIMRDVHARVLAADREEAQPCV